MHLYVIRHGQSFVNLPDWDGVDSDMPLTPLGVQQAAALANWLPSFLPEVDALYCSTMRRPRETIAPLAEAYGMEVTYDHRIREIGCNLIDHSPYPEGQTLARNDWVAFWPPERPFASVSQDGKAESAMHFRLRVASFIEDMVDRHKGQRIIAVAHGGVMDSVFDYAFGIGPWRRCAVYTYNTAVTHFEYVEKPGHEQWALHQHNSIEHLRTLENGKSF
jgi:probable phosphoglycerate mutase